MKMKAGNLFSFAMYFQDTKAVKIFKTPKTCLVQNCLNSGLSQLKVTRFTAFK